jgi:dTDP-4-amino-4,6-dideoxygalactose transaminase
MTNLAAAVLLSQLEEVNTIQEKKLELFEFYRKQLSDVECVKFQQTENTCTSSNWMFGIRLSGRSYNNAQTFFNANNIDVRPMFYPISEQPYMRQYIEQGIVRVQDETNAKVLNTEIVILPSYPDLTKTERQHIIDTVKAFTKE